MPVGLIVSRDLMKNIPTPSDGTAINTSGGAHNPHLVCNSALMKLCRLYIATGPKCRLSIRAKDPVSCYDLVVGSGEESQDFVTAGTFTTLLTASVYHSLSREFWLGITANIVDCYDFLVRRNDPGAKNIRCTIRL